MMICKCRIHALMNQQDQLLCKVRTTTTFLSLEHDTTKWQEEIAKASTFCNTLAARFPPKVPRFVY
ncbi:hypothetical protein ACMUMJ_06780 [Marinomonas sp. 2405UD68-3]